MLRFYTVLVMFLIVTSFITPLHYSIAQKSVLPEWIRNIFLWYGQKQISEQELLQAVEYLISQRIIEVTTQNANKIIDRGDFFVTYYSNPNSIYEYSAREWIQDFQYFETQIEYLNSEFLLPYDIEIVAKECDETNAFYDWQTKQIIICYEFMDYVYENFESNYGNEYTTEDKSLMALHVIDFVFYHELGHVLVDIYQLPITGLEENAVDQFATFFMLLSEAESDYEGIVGQDILFDVGTWFLIQAELDYEPIYWDTHGLDIQRFYNISCYAYGQHPQYNQDLITEGWLPEERAVNCEYEYSVLESSWNEILAPYYKKT